MPKTKSPIPRKRNIQQRDDEEEEESESVSDEDGEKSWRDGRSRLNVSGRESNTSVASSTDSPRKSPGGTDSASRYKSSFTKTGLYPDIEKLKLESLSKENYDSGQRKPSPHKSENARQDEDSSVLWIILCGVVLFLLVMWMCTSSSPNKVDQKTTSSFEKFISDVSMLEKKFPSQHRRLWKTTKASVLHVLNGSDPEYPVVLLIGSQTQHAHVAKCIAQQISSLFESALDLNANHFQTDIDQIKHLNPASQKKKLDDYLHSAFHHNQRKSVVIENLHLLSPEASLILHGYCDNDNAPFKDVMMILTLHVDEAEARLNPDKPATVETYLRNLWSSGLDTDKVLALMTRIANNVVVVGAEDDAAFKKVCS